MYKIELFFFCLTLSPYCRDIALVAYSSHGSPDNKGTVSYLLEDSWPRLYIILGWEAKTEAGDQAVEVVLSVADTHLRYEKLMERELNGLVMKVSSPGALATNILATIHY